MSTTTTVHHSAPTGGIRWGIVADGIFKLVLGIAYILACVPISSALDISVTLTVLAGVTVLLVGAAEIKFLNSRTARSYLLSLVFYDGGWVLVTVVALIAFFSEGVNLGGLWMGYQVVAAVVLTNVLFFRAGRIPTQILA